MFTVFLFYKERELLTGEGYVEVDIPWQLCRTIGPLLSQRFPLASAKAQPSGGGGFVSISLATDIYLLICDIGKM